MYEREPPGTESVTFKFVHNLTRPASDTFEFTMYFFSVTVMETFYVSDFVNFTLSSYVLC